jgi:hypothetical protein
MFVNDNGLEYPEDWWWTVGIYVDAGQIVEDFEGGEGREVYEEEGMWLNYSAPMAYDSAVAMAQELACFERGGEERGMVWMLSVIVEQHSKRIDRFVEIDRMIADTVDAEALPMWLMIRGVEWTIERMTGDGQIVDRWNGATAKIENDLFAPCRGL